MNIFFKASVISLVCLIAGCSLNNEASHRSQMESILIPEPLPVSFRSQLAIERYNQILNQSTLSEDERAQYLYMRGTQYDQVGLIGLAQYDFDRARQLKPDLADVHNSIGIHYTQQMEFIEAYEAFDSALEIDPTLDFAMLNRGIALYYGKRTDLAVSDLQAFYAKDPGYPFAALWLYIAQRELDPKFAEQQLRKHRAQLSEQSWATMIVDFYLGEISRKELLNGFVQGVQDNQELNPRMCEVYFYLGKYYASKGDIGLALNYFKLVLSTNVFDYVEHRYSRIELNLLRKQLRSDS